MNVPVPEGFALLVDGKFDCLLHKIVGAVGGRITPRWGAEGFVAVEGIPG